ncbi:MAG: GTP cyclohydrolase II [Rhodospirillaceae bacterium]|nr:MAG: GTP cyclohydrolase II [Rhodospirillaceae bacterium]
MPHRQDTPPSPQSSQTNANPCSSLSVQRAVFELRSGRMVIVGTKSGDQALILAAENVTEDNLKALRCLSEGPVHVALTGRRAKALELIDEDLGPAFRVVLNSHCTANTIHQYADPLLGTPAPSSHVEEVPSRGYEQAAIGLTKIAHLLPTALVSKLNTSGANDAKTLAKEHNLLTVQAEDVFQSEHCVSQTLQRVSEAPVPLQDAENARVIAYRPLDGGLEHLAIVIGDPTKAGKPALIRIHSQCFTGDLLGSLRCDCGDQLRGAIQAIAKDGGGVLLYLAQEGRGIGLVNKLRAYVLQDQGADTIEANEKLGFDADERIYLPAAFMLNDLGLKQVRLLTNNPTKVQALSEANIEVVDRVTHAFPSNQHNETYLQTKKIKAGHLL